MSLAAFAFNRTLKVGLQKLSTPKLPDQMLRALLTHDSILCSSAPLIMTPSAAPRRAKARDAWPPILKRIMDSQILVIATRIGQRRLQGPGTHAEKAEADD